MNIYSIIRLYQRVRSPRIKLFGILVLHVLRRRYLNMVFDPTLGCNLRCRMCYFSDPEKRKNMHGTFTDDDIQAIANSLFHRVLKLQIGCGAEPTIYKRLPQLISVARQCSIPHISLTTNGQLIDASQLRLLVENGLNEIILSTHGMMQSTYENFMQGARYDRFLQLIADIAKLKATDYPQLQLRINYTMNADNISDLQYFPSIFAKCIPNTIQIRPIQNIGNTSYSNFSTDELLAKYDTYITPLVSYCQQNNITCLYPQSENLQAIDTNEQSAQHANSAIEMLPYFQLSPFEGWRSKIDPYSESFEDYCRRTHRLRFILRHIIHPNAKNSSDHDDETQLKDVTKALNYNVT